MKRRNIKMKKEKYITPETEAIEVKASDVITTSTIVPVSDELNGITQDFFTGSGDGLYDLF